MGETRPKVNVFAGSELGLTAKQALSVRYQEVVMLKRLVFSLCLAVAVACSPASEVSATGSEESAASDEPAGARDAILAWAFGEYGQQNVFDPVEIFFGDFTGDGAPDAMAWVLYSSGGSSAMLDVALFRNEGGRMVYDRSAEAYGQSPRNVVILPGRITLTSTMPRPGDPHCCPTGSQDWTIDTN